MITVECDVHPVTGERSERFTVSQLLKEAGVYPSALAARRAMLAEGVTIHGKHFALGDPDLERFATGKVKLSAERFGRVEIQVGEGPVAEFVFERCKEKKKRWIDKKVAELAEEKRILRERVESVVAESKNG